MNLAMVVALSLAFFQAGSPGTNPSEKENIPAVLYQAYWLTYFDKGADNGYQKLLLTRGSLEEVAGPKWRVGMLGRPEPLPFDSTAMVFSTCGRDSLWEDPFKVVKKIGELDPKVKIVIVDEIKYRYEPTSVKELIRLLENPLGTNRGIHRRTYPLSGAEITTRAFLLLLKDQSSPEK